jgi:hypothetical protein
VNGPGCLFVHARAFGAARFESGEIDERALLVWHATVERFVPFQTRTPFYTALARKRPSRASASRAALAHASYAATSCPHRSVSSAFVS